MKDYTKNKKNERGKLSELIMASLTYGAALATFGVLFFLVLFIFVKGIPHITPSLFSLSYNSENVSLTPALIATMLATPMALLITAPLGVFAAIYLTEYAKRGSRWVMLVRVTTEALSGIPSIVYGLFGSLFFVLFLGWGYSMLAGVFTLSIMILPLIIRSGEEALKAVPDAYREGAFGLGAGKLRTVFRIVLPSAMPGILAGIILSIGRIVGETAALIYTAGTVAQIPTSPMQSARTLSVHMYALSTEGFHINESYATAVVLLFVVIVINAASVKISRRIGGRS
ncbi:MAG: phosphate ABC transporter permease PstA [Synergistaceae bacterium]|jgi:phosphate transport system permease protein|nr:phosphate ABC transporter permease PstA [Synergistaceae bacterium]